MRSRFIHSKLDETGRDYLQQISSGAIHMGQLIKDLLSYSLVGSQGKVFETTAVDNVLDGAIANLQVTIEKSDAKITRAVLPSVWADSVQLTQLFQNLIGNAIKFRSEKSPEIEISVKKFEARENSNHQSPATDHRAPAWLFSFRDNGIGLNPKFAERIFAIFQRLHTREDYAGTGIGLAISKKIIERHGGHIWVESEEGKGTTFYFTLPALRDQQNGN